MNLKNTKLDLSEYSEEERKLIVTSYAKSGSVTYRLSDWLCKYYFISFDCEHVTCSGDESSFAMHTHTEVKPVPHASWQIIESLDDLKVDDLIKIPISNCRFIVKHIGKVGAYCENQLDCKVILPHGTTKYLKHVTTYIFEPVIDDTFAVECYETFSKQSPHTMLPWCVLPACAKKGWREVAALIKSKGE